MKVHTATFLASSISGLSLIASLVFIANICSDVAQLWLDLDQEIGVFRAETDDLWRDMVNIGRSRQRRDTGYEEKPSKKGYDEGVNGYL